jgi:predicted RNA binding protein YcfA (HicA-like mRNA interferase family)
LKLPRDLAGTALITLLGRLGYSVTRQVGSHVRLSTTEHGEHHITVPAHRVLSVGTLDEIVARVAGHFGMGRQELTELLFGGE